jgi:hypothetical protein
VVVRPLNALAGDGQPYVLVLDDWPPPPPSRSPPTLRRNRVNRNGGRGGVEDYDLTGNERGPWSIEAAACRT